MLNIKDKKSLYRNDTEILDRLRGNCKIFFQEIKNGFSLFIIDCCRNPLYLYFNGQ